MEVIEQETAALKGETNLKCGFSSVSLKEVLRAVGQEDYQPWKIDAALQLPSHFLLGVLQRFDYSDLRSSETAKVVLTDALIS